MQAPILGTSPDNIGAFLLFFTFLFFDSLKCEAFNFADEFTIQMEDNFFSYIQRLELMAFFSAYPVLYSLVSLITGFKKFKNNLIKKIGSLLPFSYALIGSLYLGLQIRNFHIAHAASYSRQIAPYWYLTVWALLSLLFWIPLVSKRREISLVHSLVFFFFLMKDIFYQLYDSSAGKEILNNDMKVFTISLLLNIGAFLVIIIGFIFFFSKRNLPAGK